MKPLLIRRSYAKSLLFLYIKEEGIQVFPANDYSFILFGRTNKSYPNDYNNSSSYYTHRDIKNWCVYVQAPLKK